MIGMNCARTDPQVELSHEPKREEEGLQSRRWCVHVCVIIITISIIVRSSAEWNSCTLSSLSTSAKFSRRLYIEDERLWEV